MSNRQPQVSIVCAVDDDLLDANRWFHALSNQTLPPEAYEVLIIDACHKTTHQFELERYRSEHEVLAKIEYHRISPGGRAKALNHGLDLARADLIVFLGDDCEPPLNFAESHLRFHESHPDAASVAIGPALFPSKLRNPFTDWLEKSGRLWGTPMDENMATIPEDFFYAANASVKRGLLDQAGRFDERFLGYAWDDFEFGTRLRAAGMRAALLPDVIVLHMHEIDLPARERAMHRAGAAAKVYYSTHRSERAWPDSFRAKFHWVRRLLAGVRMRMKPNNGAVENWWELRLDAAFAEGYRNGGT